MHPIAKGLVGLIALFSAGLMPAQAQIRAVDPNTAIDADLAPLPSENANPTPPGQDVTVDSNVYNEQPASDNVVAENRAATSAAPVPATAPVTEANPAVYQKDDLIGAAEGVFGQGAAELAGLIEKILQEQSDPRIGGAPSGERGGEKV